MTRLAGHLTPGAKVVKRSGAGAGYGPYYLIIEDRDGDWGFQVCKKNGVDVERYGYSSQSEAEAEAKKAYSETLQKETRMNIGQLVRGKMKELAQDVSGDWLDNQGRHFSMSQCSGGYTVSYGGEAKKEMELDAASAIKLSKHCRRMNEKKLARLASFQSGDRVTVDVMADGSLESVDGVVQVDDGTNVSVKYEHPLYPGSTVIKLFPKAKVRKLAARKRLAGSGKISIEQDKGTGKWFVRIGTEALNGSDSNTPEEASKIGVKYYERTYGDTPRVEIKR